MKKILPFILLFFTFKSIAQQDSLSSVTLGIGQDSYFGFYVSASGSYSLSSNKSITFYTNYWTNPAFGDAATGTAFWTEVGGGVNLAFLDNKLNINPTLGVTYGKVLSGGEKGVLGDGIVPGISAAYSNSRFEVSAGTVWFKTLRKEGPVTVDFLWYWFVPGYKVNSRITAGIHFEDFYLSRMTCASPENLYLWIGPYLQYTFPKGVVMKAAGGYDDVNDCFIKINTIIPLGK